MDPFMENVTSVNNSQSHLDEQLVYIRRMMCVYLYPPIVVIGLVCNGLAILVLTRPTMRRNPASLCLSVLAVSDSCVLIFSACRYWVKYAINVDIQLIHPLACRLLLFLEYFSTDCSTWILCVVTLQRFVLARVPFRVADLCSYRRTILFLGLVAIMVGAKNSPFLWVARIRSLPLAGRLCQVIWWRQFWAVYSWVDLSLRLLIPFFLMLILNVWTGLRIQRAASKRRRMSCIVKVQQPRRLTDERKMRAMLLAVSICFLIAYAPFAGLMTVDGAVGLFGSAILTGNGQRYSELALLFQLFLTLIYVSHAANFFLYVASGAKFRATLFGTFRRSHQPLEWSIAPRSRPPPAGCEAYSNIKCNDVAECANL